MTLKNIPRAIWDSQQLRKEEKLSGHGKNPGSANIREWRTEEVKRLKKQEPTKWTNHRYKNL